MKNAKAKVATAATVVLLGGLGGLALSQGAKPPSKQVADKPVIRTKVIRRTLHVTKHAKPKHPPATAPVEPASASSSATPVVSGSSGSSETVPVSTGSSGSSEIPPVSTGSSGSGGGGGEVESDDGGGEVEHEGGDD